MKLIWCIYNKDESCNPKNMLLLVLGEKDNKVHALLSEGLDSADVGIIKSNNDFLDTMDLETKVRWIKEACPNTIKNYRTLKKLNLVILKEYDIKKSEPNQASQA